MTPEDRARELSKRANASGYISEDDLVEIQLAAIAEETKLCATVAVSQALNCRCDTAQKIAEKIRERIK
jgi:hypothetical protein